MQEVAIDVEFPPAHEPADWRAELREWVLFTLSIYRGHSWVLDIPVTGAPVTNQAACTNYAQGSARVTHPLGPNAAGLQAAPFNQVTLGLMAMPGQSAYNATKFAVRGFTEALREEMLIAGHQVGVTSVHPGGIKTAIARNARVSDKEDKAATAKLFDQKLARMTPERAAEIIVRGITKNQARVLVGIDAHAMHNFQKFTGSRYEDIVAKVSKRVLPAKAKVV